MKTEYVGFLMRLVCGLIDAVIVGIIGTAFLAVFRRFPDPDIGNVSFLYVNALILFGWLYFAIAESSRHQGTPGKRFLGVVVVSMDNGRIGFGRATVRYLGIVLGVLLYGIGFLFPLWTREKRGLQDIIAKTMLVYKRTTDRDLGLESASDPDDAKLAAKYDILRNLRDSGELDEAAYDDAIEKLRS